MTLTATPATVTVTPLSAACGARIDGERRLLRRCTIEGGSMLPA